MDHAKDILDILQEQLDSLGKQNCRDYYHGIYDGVEIAKRLVNEYFNEQQELRECNELLSQGNQNSATGHTDPVNHPEHYGGKDNPYEAIKVIEAHNLNFAKGNAVKYILRAGKKGDPAQDIKKAIWYLERELNNLIQVL